MYSNVVPQWQVVNNGNWREVKEAVRARPKLKRSTMKVFTGIKGVLKLRGKMLWLMKDSIPVPEYLWKLVVDSTSGEKGEWGFKALKQMIKINFRLQNFDEMMTRYKQLLAYIKSAVTRNHSEKSINSILDYISTSKEMELLQNFYETTLDALRDAENKRLWFNTMTKLGKLYFDREEFNMLARILKHLRQSCQTVDEGEDDLKKGSDKDFENVLQI